MDNVRINEEVYDRYVDASVALFMEYYAASCLDGTEPECTDNTEFPKTLDARCRALINRECARQRRKTFLKAAGKGLRVVACFAAVILALSSILFMTVDAVRVSIIKYYIAQSDGYWEITGEGSSSESLDTDKIDLSDPLAGLIPEEYKLTKLYYESDSLVAIYYSPAGEELLFSVEPAKNVKQIDSEDAETSKKCEILGYDAVLVIEDGFIHLTWLHEESMFIYGLETNGLDETAVIAIAKQIIQEFSM